MNRSRGVNYLFDVLFHEIMESHPAVRDRLNNELSCYYDQYTASQRQALDDVFGRLFRVSFTEVFKPRVTH